MTPSLRALAALLALGLATLAARVEAQPLRPDALPPAAREAIAKADVAKALALFDARRVLRRADGGFDAPDAPQAAALEARQLLQSAAFAGDAEARDYAGRMAQAGIGGPADAPLARKFYEEAATRSARWRLAGMLERGEGGPPDPLSARALYKLASDMGQLDARYDYARMARAGQGGDPAPDAARAALASMSAFCHADAANALAEMADKGEGGPRDPALAARNYLRALECRSRFYAAPDVVTRWSAISRETRVEIALLLRERGLADAPLDGAQPPKGWETRYLAALKG